MTLCNFRVQTHFRTVADTFLPKKPGEVLESFVSSISKSVSFLKLFPDPAG